MPVMLILVSLNERGRGLRTRELGDPRRAKRSSFVIDIVLSVEASVHLGCARHETERKEKKDT